MIEKRKMRKASPGLYLVLFFAVGIMFFGLSPFAGAHVLDHMNTGQQSVELKDATTYGENATTASEAVGGFRYINLLVNNNAGFSNTAKVILAAPHRFGMVLGDLTDGNASIVWSGTLNPTSCALGLDLYHQPNAATQFFLDPVAIDHNALICIDVYYPSGTCANKATSCKKKFAFDANVWPFPFSEFGIPYSSFGSIGRLSMRIVGIPIESTGLDISIHSIGDNCTIGAPGISTFTAVPPVQVTPVNTDLCWTGITLQPGEPSPVTVRVVGISGGALGYSWSGTSAGGNGCAADHVPSSLPATYRLKVVGICDNATRDATVTLEPSRVPSLNEWGMILLALFLAAGAVYQLRRRKMS